MRGNRRGRIFRSKDFVGRVYDFEGRFTERGGGMCGKDIGYAGVKILL